MLTVYNQWMFESRRAFAHRSGAVMSSKDVQHELITHLPQLRAFGISLCGDVDVADDLVQETILNAWGHLDSFREGSSLRAWLFTILRNAYFSQLRRRRPEAPIDEEVAKTVGKAPEQYGWMESRDLLKALGQLSPEQREAIVLFGAEGCSYEEVAEICGCPVGTVKSRVNRARLRLLELLGEPPRKLGPTPIRSRRPHTAGDHDLGTPVQSRTSSIMNKAMVTALPTRQETDEASP